MNKKSILSIVLILLVTAAAHRLSVDNGWTTWDDPEYVTDNAAVRGISTDHLSSAWTKHYNGSYLPLTIMSYMVDYTVGEFDPAVYHTTNLLFHLCNTFLAFLFTYVLTGRKLIASVIVAIVFGVHPTHVESVAWISARKDVLSGFFFFLSLLSYMHYVQKARYSGLVFAFTFFFFAILSKITVFVLPVVLLLIDYYTGRQWNIRLAKEKVPFFVVSIALVIVGLYAQSAAGAIRNSSALQAMIVPHYSLYFYLEKFFLPTGLSSLYPYPKMTDGFFPLRVYLAIPVVYAVGYAVWKNRNEKNIVFGFLFFLVLILPVLQLVRFSAIVAADRFTYLSYVGLSFPIGMLAEWIYAKSARRGKGTVIALVVIVTMVLSILTMERIPVWKDSTTLWNDVFSKYPDALL